MRQFYSVDANGEGTADNPWGCPYVQKDGVRNPDVDTITDHDGRGVRACLNAQRLAREQGYELVFSEPEGIVARVIRVLGLESMMLGSASDE